MIKEFTQKDGKKLTLSESAIKHIIEGDFTIRPIQGHDNMTVLRGGLHTYDAWVKFKKNYINELEHLHFFHSLQHKYWYYARELGNGVITLRIPRELFTGNAAKITMYPDEYYKSGFLWKTLFPKGYDRDKIIKVIEEALDNEDIHQRKAGQIIGYINKNNPLLKMKVTIQHHGKEIKSAFPAWTQPNSGNNGKPYSHYDNIGFVIAQSTEYFDDEHKISTIKNFLFPGFPIMAEELHLHTPSIFTTRKKPIKNESPTLRAANRLKELKEFIVTYEDNNLIYKYLNDFALIKYNPELVSGIYASARYEISESLSFFNTFQIIQNFVDGLYYLYLTNQEQRLIETIVFMLNNMVSHTLLDILSKKRIISAMINIVSSANIPELSYKFVLALAKSPIRREAYLEYNLDSLSKKKLTEKTPLDHFPDELVMIVNPSLDISIERQDFIEILKEIIGETYTLNFNEEKLNSLLEETLNNQSENFNVLIDDYLSHSTPKDFISLSEFIGDILNSAAKYTNGDREQLIASAGLILRDYCRIQFAHRQRINARYISYHDHTAEIYLPIDNDLLFGFILKHERITNHVKLENFTKAIINFANIISDQALENDSKNFMDKIGKDRPPLPEKL
ncbi:hypothetical protein VCX45_11030 [Aeromonas caviae]|uniref:hypothetical protein n=1 Tax=Aeromonas TaxID=642 RepID=UPI002B246429|nr:hypothetical protein [Aeromonas caviae]MEA9441214.1 hypothetical protein [Aeromonas caviae]